MWTHALCGICWTNRYPERRPHRVVTANTRGDVCCDCGQLTWAGIYVRLDPKALACQGVSGYHLTRARRALAQRFYDLVIAFVEKDADDPTRPAWGDVDAAQQAYLRAEGITQVRQHD